MKRALPFGRFKKDLKRITKRGWDIERLNAVITLLQSGRQLPENAFLHKLSGAYVGLWECHVGPDWLLVFDATPDVILLNRTGSPPDPFK